MALGFIPTGFQGDDALVEVLLVCSRRSPLSECLPPLSFVYKEGKGK
jgi:hypothetical protein